MRLEFIVPHPGKKPDSWTADWPTIPRLDELIAHRRAIYRVSEVMYASPKAVRVYLTQVGSRTNTRGGVELSSFAPRLQLRF